MGKLKDISGMRFGRLTVITFTRVDPITHNSLWLCRCDCGRKVETRSISLRKGDTRSCGCLAAEWRGSPKIHGHATGGKTTKTYNSWASMVERCTVPTSTSYPNYGGRGVAVCGEWLDFSAFLKDMGERPPGTSLDRFPDNDGDYRPGNCRWATRKEQANNRRPRRWRRKPNAG